MKNKRNIILFAICMDILAGLIILCMMEKKKEVIIDTLE